MLFAFKHYDALRKENLLQDYDAFADTFFKKQELPYVL